MNTTRFQQHRLRMSAPLHLLLLVLAAPSASASPLFSVGDGQPVSWGAAAGNIRVAGEGGSPGPVNPDSAAFRFYETAIGTNMFGVEVQRVLAAQNVRLFPDVQVADASNRSHESLVMSWENNPGDDVLNVAAWDYVYDVDPDLTDLEIKFSILPPPGVWDFSLELYDVKGSSIGWFGVPPNSNWNSVVIDPSVQAAQGPFTAFFAGANPNGAFDLTQVAFLRLNESSQTGVSFIDFPVPPGGGGPVIPGGQPWNAWNHLVVTTPEPVSVALFLSGLAALGLARTRPDRAASRRRA